MEALVMSQSIRQQRTYDAEFKREAVLLVTEKGRSCPDVAVALGIPLGTLYKWVEEYKKHRIDPFPGKRKLHACLLYTSDAADDLLCVDLGGRRIIKKKK